MVILKVTRARHATRFRLCVRSPFVYAGHLERTFHELAFSHHPSGLSKSGSGGPTYKVGFKGIILILK